MTPEEIVQSNIEESIRTKERVLAELQSEILSAGDILSNCLEKGGTIFFCGNGGSSCDAAHIAAELVVRYKSGNERRALPAMCLASDMAVLTACSNDYGYKDVFARQVEAFGKPGDVLVGITTSGNSENVILAVDAAKKRQMKCISLLGGTGGKLKGKTDLEIIVPSQVTARIQESHILIGHILCSLVEKQLFQMD